MGTNLDDAFDALRSEMIDLEKQLGNKVIDALADAGLLKYVLTALDIDRKELAEPVDLPPPEVKPQKGRAVPTSMRPTEVRREAMRRLAGARHLPTSIFTEWLRKWLEPNKLVKEIDVEGEPHYEITDAGHALIAKWND